jgi:hypothetical protein
MNCKLSKSVTLNGIFFFISMREQFKSDIHLLFETVYSVLSYACRNSFTD